MKNRTIQRNWKEHKAVMTDDHIDWTAHTLENCYCGESVSARIVREDLARFNWTQLQQTAPGEYIVRVHGRLWYVGKLRDIDDNPTDDVAFKMNVDDQGRVGMDKVEVVRPFKRVQDGDAVRSEYNHDDTPFKSFVLTTTFHEDKARQIRAILNGRSYYNPEILLVPTPGGIEITVQVQTDDPVDKVKEMFLMILTDELIARV